MRKIFIITFVLMMALCASTFATGTRTLVMGDNDRVLVDDGNVYRFPGRIYNYPNLAIGEFNSSSFHNFGINWQMGSDNPWVMGTYFSTMGPVGPTFMDGSNMISAPWTTSDRRMTLLYGRQMGNNNLGLSFDYIRGGMENDDSTDVTEKSFGFYQFTFGLTEGSTGAWDVALKANFGSWTDKDTVGDDIYKSDGYTDFGIEGRYFMVKGPKITMVPHLSFMTQSRGRTDPARDDPAVDTFATDLDTLAFATKQTGFTFDLGMGLNYTSGPNLLAVADYGILFKKRKTEAIEREMDTLGVWQAVAHDNDTKTLTILYFKIGLEADVFKWMDIRMGATSFWNGTKTTNDRVGVFDTKMSSTSNNTYLGFGFHWGRLSVDAQTSPQLFLNGFNFISGRNTTMNSQLSVLYEMF